VCAELGHVCLGLGAAVPTATYPSLCLPHPFSSCHLFSILFSISPRGSHFSQAAREAALSPASLALPSSQTPLMMTPADVGEGKGDDVRSSHVKSAAGPGSGAGVLRLKREGEERMVAVRMREDGLHRALINSISERYLMMRLMRHAGGVETERAAPSNQKEPRGGLRAGSTSGAPGFVSKEARFVNKEACPLCGLEACLRRVPLFTLKSRHACWRHDTCALRYMRFHWVCRWPAVACDAAAVCFAMCSQCTFRFRLLQTHWIDPAGWKKRGSGKCRWNVTGSGHGCRSHTCL
jgi:hypothetical protein